MLRSARAVKMLGYLYSMREDVFKVLLEAQKVFGDSLKPEAKRYLERLITFGKRNGKYCFIKYENIHFFFGILMSIRWCHFEHYFVSGGGSDKPRIDRHSSSLGFIRATGIYICVMLAMIVIGCRGHNYTL